MTTCKCIFSITFLLIFQRGATIYKFLHPALTPDLKGVQIPACYRGNVSWTMELNKGEMNIFSLQIMLCTGYCLVTTPTLGTGRGRGFVRCAVRR